MAMVGQPENNRNYRGNPSLVVHTPANTYIQIDVGKTFRENMVRPREGSPSASGISCRWVYRVAALCPVF